MRATQELLAIASTILDWIADQEQLGKNSGRAHFGVFQQNRPTAAERVSNKQPLLSALHLEFTTVDARPASGTELACHSGTAKRGRGCASARESPLKATQPLHHFSLVASTLHSLIR